MNLKEKIRNWLIGDKLCHLEAENRELKRHLLSLSGYDKPQAEILSRTIPLDTLKEVSNTRVQPRSRSMSWPAWAKKKEAELQAERLRSRVARKNPEDTV